MKALSKYAVNKINFDMMGIKAIGLKLCTRVNKGLVHNHKLAFFCMVCCCRVIGQ